jgi:hypothetical protein
MKIPAKQALKCRPLENNENSLRQNASVLGHHAPINRAACDLKAQIFFEKQLSDTRPGFLGCRHRFCPHFFSRTS